MKSAIANQYTQTRLNTLSPVSFILQFIILSFWRDSLSSKGDKMIIFLAREKNVSVNLFDTQVPPLSSDLTSVDGEVSLRAMRSLQ